jgi:hypothetical protein
LLLCYSNSAAACIGPFRHCRVGCFQQGADLFSGLHRIMWRIVPSAVDFQGTGLLALAEFDRNGDGTIRNDI